MTPRAMGQVVGTVATLLDGAFESVIRLRDSVASQSVAAVDPLTRRDLARLGTDVVPEMAVSGGLIRGMGVALAPQLLMDASLWIEWWVLDEDGTSDRVRFEFDPDSLDFYDYTRADWFTGPRTPGHRTVVGPYVDYNGLNDYVVTMTTPILAGGRFLGVAGADLRVDAIERRLYALHDASVADVLLSDSTHRVIASTSTRHLAGSLFRGLAASDTADIRAVPGWPWSMVRLPGQ